MRKDAPLITCFHLNIAARAAGESEPRKLIDDLSMEVGRGSWNEVVGPSGAGKSLLFGILSLRLEADDGKLVLDGRNFHRLSRRGICELRRRFTSCAQEPVLLENRTVIENLVLPFVVRREEHKALPLCDELLEEANVAHLRDVRVVNLSQQERIIVGVLRAVAGEPQAIVVDDVLHCVEEGARLMLLRMLQRSHLRGATVVLFGREQTAQARRGVVFHLEKGTIAEIEDNTSSHPRSPEAGHRV
mgnify:CR=1 FL=1